MSAMLHVGMDDEIERQGTEALNAMGLSAPDAVRILYHRIIADQAFPLELKVSNATTRAAMDEADVIAHERRALFDDPDEMIGALER